MSNPGPAVTTTSNSTGGVYYGTFTCQTTFSTVGAALTNPTIQSTTSVNNYCQIAIQNLSNGNNASADLVAYPDNITNDSTGFIDVGIASSGFSQSAYSVTVSNESYIFGSAPAGSGTSGDMVIATDSSGTSNSIRFYTNGFNKAIGLWAAKIIGSSGLFAFAFGRALTGSSKVIVNNGATTTYTVPAGASYVNITTSAASLAFTFPAAAALIDGIEIIINPSASVATATWSSSGATFIGSPSSLIANTSVRFIYDHATLKWYQF